MQLTAHSRRSAIEKRREELRRRRLMGGPIAMAHPGVERIRLELRFLDSEGVQPAAQIHDRYPAAPAHFEFPCPYGDCDGVLDLTEAVASLLSRSRSRAVGETACPGARTGPGMARRPCSLRLHYRIAADYERPAD